MKRVIGSVLVATMVVLAGCAGGVAPTGSTGSPGDGDAAGDGAAGGDGGSGTVTMYVSDRPNAIEDFEHLNVTITRVGFHRVGDASDGNESGSDGNESAANETAENETEESESDGDGGGEWVTHNVSKRTVDLTRLQGANATRLADFDVPDGEYDAVFVYVSDVNATLKNGEQVRVKLPSGKLKLNEGFAMGANSSVDFVFDITVTKAGKSGKYVLQPVVSESGTDVPIDEVGEDDEKGEDEKRDGEKGEERESALNASFVGNVTAGENATVEVTRNGSAVANATVTVNDEVVGTTDADGRLTFAVPDVKELDVKIEAGDAEAELEVEFGPEKKDGEGQGSDQGQGNDG